jgi:hypothetical protein
LLGYRTTDTSQSKNLKEDHSITHFLANMTKNKNKKQERKIMCKIRRFKLRRRRNVAHFKQGRLKVKSSLKGLSLISSLASADSHKINNSSSLRRLSLKPSPASADSSHNKFANEKRTRVTQNLRFHKRFKRKRTLRPCICTVSRFHRRFNRKGTLRPCIYTVSPETLEHRSTGNKIHQNYSNFQTLVLRSKKSKKMSNQDGRNYKRKIVFDDGTPKRRVVARKTSLANRLGDISQEEDPPNTPDFVPLRPTNMKHKIDRIGRELLPTDSIGPPGCELNTITIQSRWIGIENLRKLQLFTRAIFVSDITDDVLQHPRFPELYGDPMTRFLPDRMYYYDQPFDHANNALVKVNGHRRDEYRKRTFNRLHMLADAARVSTVLSICHPHLYEKMIAFNPKFDAAPQAEVELGSIREIFLEYNRATACEHFHDIRLGLPGRTKLLAEFKRRPYILREARPPNNQLALLPGVGPERVVEVEKVIEVVKQEYIQVIPTGTRKMVQDILYLVNMAPKLAQELKTMTEGIPEVHELVEDNDEEMDRENDPELGDQDGEETEEGTESTPKDSYDNPSDNLPMTPSVARSSVISTKIFEMETFDVVTASTSRDYSYEIKAATAGQQKCYLRRGEPIKGQKSRNIYDVQALNDQETGRPMEGQDCPDFREGRLVYARDSLARPSQSMRCHNWRCLAKDPIHFREDGVDPTTRPYEIRRAIDVNETLSLTTGRFFIKDRSHSWIVNYGKGSRTEKWPDASRRLRELNFIERIKGDAWMSFDVEGITNAIKQGYIDAGACTYADTLKAFSVVHFGASSGAILQIQVNYNGCEILGNDIPDEIRELLTDPNIYKCQYAIQNDAKKLDHINIMVNNCVDMRNVSMECFPQRHIDRLEECRDGVGIAQDKLDSPARFYTPSKKNPPVNGIAINYETLDMTKPFDEWPRHWHWYNANDNLVVLAMLDRIGVRCVQNEGLDMRADIGRHVRAYLARLRGKARYLDKDGRTDDNSRPYDWMEGEVDTKLGVQPMMGLHPGPNITPHQLMSNIRTNKRHNIVDKYQILPEVLTVYENIMGSTDHGGKKLRFEDWRLNAAMDYSYKEQAGGKHFPHMCARCGSTFHLVGDCTVEPDVGCAFNLCRGSGHTITICPMLNQKNCGSCYYMGHDKEHHYNASYERLRNEFQIAAYLGAIACRYVDNTFTYRMNTSTRTVDVLEEDDPLAVAPAKRFKRDEVADHALRALKIKIEKDKKKDSKSGH